MSVIPETAVDTAGWYLEGCGTDNRVWLVHLRQFPFIVGRLDGCDLQLATAEISRRHAEFFHAGEQIGLRDLGSANGTYVNRERLEGDRPLCHGDIVHFGHQEFRVAYKQPRQAEAMESTTTFVLNPNLPKGLFGYCKEFDELLSRRAVLPHYQPLARLADLRLIGYELLGRGGFIGLPDSPGPLFEIARGLGKEIELSTLFREAGVAIASRLDQNLNLFFNTVPAETNLAFLRDALPRLKTLAPHLIMTMEIHETAVTNITLMRELRALLSDLCFMLAYDDFGAGQARLLELIEVPPDVLKFDIALIRNIHQRPERAEVVRTLVSMARNLGIHTLAEGTELPEELEVCRQIGFDYVQGYAIGRPSPHFVSTPTLSIIAPD